MLHNQEVPIPATGVCSARVACIQCSEHTLSAPTLEGRKPTEALEIPAVGEIPAGAPVISELPPAANPSVELLTISEVAVLSLPHYPELYSIPRRWKLPGVKARCLIYV